MNSVVVSRIGFRQSLTSTRPVRWDRARTPPYSLPTNTSAREASIGSTSQLPSQPAMRSPASSARSTSRARSSMFRSLEQQSSSASDCSVSDGCAPCGNPESNRNTPNNHPAFGMIIGAPFPRPSLSSKNHKARNVGCQFEALPFLIDQPPSRFCKRTRSRTMPSGTRSAWPM